VEEALAALDGEHAALLGHVLCELTVLREAAAAATPEPERVYESDGYSRALLM
jgi:hypothetical protein